MQPPRNNPAPSAGPPEPAESDATDQPFAEPLRRVREPDRPPTQAARAAGPTTPPTPGERLLLIGGSVRAAAESARRAGLVPLALDLFGDRETRRAAAAWSALPSGPAEAVRLRQQLAQSETPLILAGGLDGQPTWLPDLPQRYRGATPELLRRCEMPDFLQGLASAAGVDFPETRGPPATRSAAQRLQRGRWLVKRRASCGGLGVLDHHFDVPIEGDAVLQAFVRGRVCGATYVADGATSLWLGLCRTLTRRLGKRRFVYAGSLGPLPVTAPVRAALVRLGQCFVDQTGFGGPFNLDVVIRGDRVVLLEVNPRWSASMENVERHYGDRLREPCSFFQPLTDWSARFDAKASMGTTSEGTRTDAIRGAIYMKRIVYSDRSVWVTPAEFDAHERGQPWRWTDVPAEPTRVGRHEPLATLITRLDQLSLVRALRLGPFPPLAAAEPGARRV